ncbi:hypothetical protein [Sagittula salina]|uniref:Uncharacterized protein n=1 Tax=Sagittula salina TaxID=2820268 RepID=A0A940MR81_9RHOB|nr:hypothetical protein [Sagittula salina]MBP0483909.1 hypothetical protein [Sagittula salina]
MIPTTDDTLTGLPPVAPLDMPTQVLERVNPAGDSPRAAMQSLLARLFLRHA